LRLLSDGVRVLADHSNSSGIPVGSEIVSIDGEDVAEVMASLRSLVTTDGFNEAAARMRLGMEFASYRALTRGFPPTLTVAWRAPGQDVVATTEIGAVGRDVLRAGQRLLAAADPQEDQYLDIDILADHGVARMTIRSFVFYDRIDYFRAFVDSSMALVRQADVDGLILDLRGNAGGDPWCAAWLLAYLIDEPIPFYAQEYGSYAPLAAPVARAEHPFTGELYVLTDPRCFSTTGHLCSLLKYHGIGTFVGEETAGTYSCNDASKMIELHNTRLQLNLPRMTFATAVTGLERGEGIQPDHMVRPTGADLAAGHDAALELALELASGKAGS
jgi:hypothetical protein